MGKTDIYQRTFDFALKIIKLVDEMTNTVSTKVIMNQLLRSACSIGANLREGMRSRTKKEFVSSFGISLKEAEETLYWLNLLSKSQLTETTKYDIVIKECDEIIRVIATIIKNSKKRSV